MSRVEDDEDAKRRVHWIHSRYLKYSRKPSTSEQSNDEKPTGMNGNNNQTEKCKGKASLLEHGVIDCVFQLQ